MNLFLFLKIMEDPKELSYMWFVSINLNMIEIRTKKCLNYLYISSFKIITSLLNVHQKSTVLWQKNFLQDKIRKNSWIRIRIYIPTIVIHCFGYSIWTKSSPTKTFSWKKRSALIAECFITFSENCEGSTLILYHKSTSFI